MVCKDLKSVVKTNLSSPIQSWLTSLGTGKTWSPSRQNRQEELKSVATKSLDKITLWFLICCCLCFCTDYDTPQQRLCGQQQQSSLRAAAQCQKKSSLRSHLVSVSKKTSSPQALQQPTFQKTKKTLNSLFWKQDFLHIKITEWTSSGPYLSTGSAVFCWGCVFRIESRFESRF